MKKALLINHHRPFDSGLVSKVLFESHFLISTINSNDVKFLNLSDIKKYNLVIFFGGNASANDRSLGIKYEFNLIEILAKYQIPTIGICLGAQLIAKFYGSKIIFNNDKKSEIGYREIFNPDLSTFKKNNVTFMQFHNQGICQNKFMNVLGFGRSFEVDAFKIKKIPFYGLQFHPEVDSPTILRWYSTNSELISKYKDSLKKSLINYKKFSPENYIWLKSFLLRVLK